MDDEESILEEPNHTKKRVPLSPTQAHVDIRRMVPAYGWTGSKSIYKAHKSLLESYGSPIQQPMQITKNGPRFIRYARSYK